MPFSRILSPIRLALVSVLILSVFTILPRLTSEYQRSRRLGLLVGSIIQEEFSGLSRHKAPENVVRSRSDWPDEYGLLRTWLVLESVRVRDPVVLSRRFVALSRGHQLSNLTSTSIRRWSSALSQWQESDRRIASLSESSNFSSVQLLEEGREVLHEGIGYEQVGRQFDSTVFYLWAIERFRSFVQASPDHPLMPEAVFMLGDAYIRIRDALPTGVRSDRFLNLCSELFPRSAWAARSVSVWRGVMANGV